MDQSVACVFWLRRGDHDLCGKRGDSRSAAVAADQLYEPRALPVAHLALVYGQEVLLALLDSELNEVRQGWSQSLYLSYMLHAGMMREHVVHRLMAAQSDERAADLMREILATQQFFYSSEVPDQEALLARFAKQRDWKRLLARK